MKRALGLLLFVAAVPLRASVPDWVLSASTTTVPAAFAGDAKAVVVFDSKEVSVAGGEITTHRRRAVRIMTAAGRDVASFYVHYDKETQLRSFKAWAIAGSVTRQFGDREAFEANPYNELFDDSRVKALSIPNVDPGTVVAWEYEQRERPNALQAIWDFQEDLPVLSANCQVAVPPGWEVDLRWFHHDPVAPSVATPGSFIWELREVPALKDEPHMPAFTAVAGRVAFNFLPGEAGSPKIHRSWDDVARWFADLATSRCVPSPEIQAKVRELAPESAAPIERLAALARFAQRDVRYVAVEIGIGGYQPHAAGDIFRNRYGDCKDKVTILRTMLAAAGVESYYVLVNTDRGTIDPAFATAALFNHAIIAIRLPKGVASPDFFATYDHPTLGKLLIFDPTSSETPFGRIPDYEQEGHALLVTGTAGELITLPAAPPVANQLRRRAKLQLSADGAISGDVEEVRTGMFASRLRYAFRTMNSTERTRAIEQMVASHMASSEVRDLKIDNAEEPRADLVIHYQLAAPRYASRAAELTLLRPRVLGEKADTQIDLVSRQQPYVTDGPSLQVDDVEIAVPPQLKLDELPPPASITVPALGYSSSSKFESGVLHYRREMTTRAFTVPLASLPELNRAFAKISSDERSTAVFVEKP
ncbi:MAG TPA: DUF3857 domain-containing transglutaminase family protein [Thermoanaerobaculia bacterium]|nr:DUF3857 domain-containing transglutaminase family protein [Thermoanaerobaculia bacterium]